MEVEKKINSVKAAGCFQASMTVEASFLLPLIFFLILNILTINWLFAIQKQKITLNRPLLLSPR